MKISKGRFSAMMVDSIVSGSNLYIVLPFSVLVRYESMSDLGIHFICERFEDSLISVRCSLVSNTSMLPVDLPPGKVSVEEIKTNLPEGEIDEFETRLPSKIS